MASATPPQGPPVKYGTTDPICLKEPTDADNALTQRMMEELEVEFPSETGEGMKHRQDVLKELERVVQAWMVEVGVNEGMSEDEAKKGVVAPLTLGSYRLGVVSPASDIDALCIGPPHVTREAFFKDFIDKLKSHEHVSECVPIPDAYTPIVKFKMRSVSIDLLFARLTKPLGDNDVLEEVVREDEIVRNMDEKSIRCLNAYRVADQILQLVPNRESFRQTLRFVKCWARRRGIYSNVLGFFGGITWALLVARVCQLYPYYSSSQLVNRFFRLYDQWNWSKPVMLCEVVEPPGLSGPNLKPWNPKANPADRQHVMPVITPAFPAMNSTHNVTETTKRILLDEFRRGYDVVKTVEAQKVKWNEVHSPYPYFTQFRQFLWLEVLAKSEEVYQKFSGWVESKLRILSKQLETVGHGMIIHPNPEQYHLRNSDPDWPLGCGMFIAVAFFKDQGAFLGQSVDLRPALAQFIDVVNQWTEKDIFPGQFLLRAKRIRATQLPQYVLEAEAEKKRPQSQLDPGAIAGTPEAKKARIPTA